MNVYFGEIIRDGGGLSKYGPAEDSSDTAHHWDYVSWHPTSETVTLDGEFGPEQLEALAAYMRANHRDYHA